MNKKDREELANDIDKMAEAFKKLSIKLRK